MIEVETNHLGSTVVLDITSSSSIIRIRSILEVGAVIEGLPRHSRLWFARCVEEKELLSMVDTPGSGRKARYSEQKGEVCYKW